MKSIELFLALSVATSLSISTAETVNASEYILNNEEADTLLIVEGGEGHADHEGGEGEEPIIPVEGGEGS